MNEKENTLRTLAEKTKLVTSIWCRVGVHNWEQWCAPYVVKGGYQNIQHRYCACCNKISLRKVKVPL